MTKINPRDGEYIFGNAIYGSIFFSSASRMANNLKVYHIPIMHANELGNGYI